MVSGDGDMRVTALAAGLLIAGSLAAEAEAMRLATFDFQGTVNSSLTVPHTIAGSFTIDLDAAYSEAADKYPNAIIDFTVAYNSSHGMATGQYNPGGIFGRSPLILFLGQTRQGVAIRSNNSGERLTISAPLSGEPGFIYQTVSPFLSVSDTFLQLNGFEMTAFGAIDTSAEIGLSAESILALANQGMGFELFGRTSDQGTVTGTTSDFFIPFEPDPNEFIAEGTINSLTLVSQVPLPAAAWLMLSALATLVGFKALPRLRRS